MAGAALFPLLLKLHQDIFVLAIYPFRYLYDDNLFGFEVTACIGS